MRSIASRARGPLVLAGMLAVFGPGAVVGQGGSLKDIQRSIRERMLTEAGANELVYTKVDFSHCAATIQSRSLKQLGAPEIRVTTTFHFASLLDSAAIDPGGPPFVVRVTSAGQAPGIRRLEQVIDSGRVRESATTVASFAVGFDRRGTAEVVREGFGRLVTMCRGDDPLLRAPSGRPE